MIGEYPRKQEVVGTPVSVTTFDDVHEVISSPRPDRATVVAVCNVHSVMTARRNSALARALKEADVATPDGMPLVWALRALGNECPERVYGPEIMRRVLSGPQGNRSHVFFGSTPDTLAKLVENIRHANPEVTVADAISPPFRELTVAEELAYIEHIRSLEADVVWVGLGMPKQELWMDRVKHELPGMTVVGVGAAFDFLAGTKQQAPMWMRDKGLEWVYRLSQEPRRLWRRYAWNNPAFLVLLGAQIARYRLQGHRPGSSEREAGPSRNTGKEQ